MSIIYSFCYSQLLLNLEELLVFLFLPLVGKGTTLLGLDLNTF